MLQVTNSVRALLLITLLAVVTLSGSGVARGAPAARANLTDNEQTFTTVGQDVAHDINVLDNKGGLRYYRSPTLTGMPNCAAIQFFGNQSSGFPGQLFLDSGANNSAAIRFRTAGTGGTITERMTIDRNGNVGIGAAPLSSIRLRIGGGALRVGNPSNGASCAVSPPGLCSEGGITTNDNVFAVGHVAAVVSVRAGTPSDIICNASGDICAETDVVAVNQVRAGTVTSTKCLGAGDICAGDDVVAQSDVFADKQVRAGTIDSSQCDTDLGDICAGDDLIADDDVFAGSGSVLDGSGGCIVGACSSDVRLKKDIAAINPVLARLVALQPVTFDWRRDEFPELGLATAPGMGLIAQEVEAVLPDLVSVDRNGYKTVHYERLPILMLQGIRELAEANATLTAQMAAKDDRIAALEEQLAALQQQNATQEARLAAIERMIGAAPLVQAQR